MVKRINTERARYYSGRIVKLGKEEVEFENKKEADDFISYLDAEWVKAKKLRKPVGQDTYVYVIIVSRKNSVKANKLFKEWKKYGRI